MDDLNDTLCVVIQEITNFPVESIALMSDGIYLPLILEKINSQEFNRNDASLTNWKTAKERLEHFLESNQIVDRQLDFALKDIENGDFEAILGAILQIFAIFVTFNKPGWDQIMKAVGFVTFTHVTKLLGDMVNGLKELLEMTKQSKRMGHEDLNLRSLLNKLESKEKEMEIQSEEIKQLNEKLNQEKTETKKLTKTIEKLEKELLETHEIKDKAVEDLVRKDSELGLDNSVDKQNQKTREYEREISQLKTKLETTTTFLVDRDCEIDKLSSLLNNLNMNQNQNEDLKKQLEHYENSAKEIKLSNEYLTSKLNSLSNVDTLIKNLNMRLKEEKDNSLKFEAQLNEARPLIENLQKRIDILETTNRFSGKNTKSVTEFGDFYSLELFKNFESENQQYKRKLEELQTSNLNYQQRLFSDSIIEKENEALRAQIDTFLENGDASVLRKTNIGESGSFGALEFPDQIFRGESAFDKKVSSLEQFPTSDFSVDQNRAEVFENRVNGHFSLNSEIIYTTLMEFYRNELAEQKKFVFARPERERNILKQFMLSDMLQSEK